jgi:antitoxin (DNA-binding transcriptional repressor) of toxin-antitoxin stability system
MRAVNLRDAKSHLNELIEAATRGEQVVLMRGSQHVAAIVPITADELELVTPLTDMQAERLWRQLAAERAAGTTVTYESAESAVAALAAETSPAHGKGATTKSPRRARPSTRKPRR